MKYSLWTFVFAGLTASFSPATWAADDLEEHAASSRALIKQFGASLQNELQTALAEKGPEHALGVCQIAAPEIAYRQAEQSGWTVARTSLRARNPANEPDLWEETVLDEFEVRIMGGEPVETIEFFEIVEKDGQDVFRYMKAIPTGEVCLTCHGAEIAPSVQQVIADIYPDDQATDFFVGDLRGAFTITQPLD